VDLPEPERPVMEMTYTCGSGMVDCHKADIVLESWNHVIGGVGLNAERGMELV